MGLRSMLRSRWRLIGTIFLRRTSNASGKVAITEKYLLGVIISFLSALVTLNALNYWPIGLQAFAFILSIILIWLCGAWVFLLYGSFDERHVSPLLWKKSLRTDLKLSSNNIERRKIFIVRHAFFVGLFTLCCVSFAFLSIEIYSALFIYISIYINEVPVKADALDRFYAIFLFMFFQSDVNIKPNDDGSTLLVMVIFALRAFAVLIIAPFLLKGAVGSND